MAGDVPSVFQVQSAAPSLPAVPGLIRCLAATEPCSALSGSVSTPANPDVLGCSICRHNNVAYSDYPAAITTSNNKYPDL